MRQALCREIGIIQVALGALISDRSVFFFARGGWVIGGLWIVLGISLVAMGAWKIFCPSPSDD